MDSPTRKITHEALARASTRDKQEYTPTRWFRWLHHPFIAFAVPLTRLFFSLKIFNLVVSPHSASHPYNGTQLQEIASLLDDIYTVMANMTFIPPTSIKRGPHHINTTAIPCKRDPAVMRLMEIMSYVDSIEVQEKDWLFGGSFIDYRRPDHLVEGCDPLPAQETWFNMTPGTVALTRWGTGGWNGDQTWIILYDPARNALHVYEGEEWIALYDKDGPHTSIHGEYSGIGIFSEGDGARLSVMSRDDQDWNIWFDAPTLLRRLLDAYQSLAWTPWETSDKEDGWGVAPATIKDLLRKSGWPDKFDSDKFNTNFIRAKHKNSGRGPAEAAFKTIEELEGTIDEDGHKHLGRLHFYRRQVMQLEEKIAKEKNEQERWFLRLRAQTSKWDLERDETDLEAAKRQVKGLCPEGVCVKEENMVLWEFKSLEREYEKAQRTSPPEKICEWDLDDLVEWARAPDRYDNCLAQKKREAQWLHLAFSQAKAEALQHCASTGCTLLPQPTLEELVEAKLEGIQDYITRAHERTRLLHDWKHNLPELATKAWEEFERHASAAANGPWMILEQQEWLEEQLSEGGDKVKLRRSLDDPSCM